MRVATYGITTFKNDIHIKNNVQWALILTGFYLINKSSLYYIFFIKEHTYTKLVIFSIAHGFFTIPIYSFQTRSVDIPIAKGDPEPQADQAAPMLGPDFVQIRPPADSDVISEPAILGDTPKKGDTGEPDAVVVAGNSAGIG